ncbi:putative dehydrogenase [Opitutaceae bacterium TAV1]|nr:putative dehydrogenase [Opitutaceae bacterium TAV1]
MATPLRYALVGTGSRAFMFRDALAGPHAPQGKLVALCDINPLRAAAWQADLPEKLPVYAPGDFARMIREERIDRVIVTSMDRTHHRYICAAMEAGCDVISEKPMTTDADKCTQILRTMAATGRDLRVTFNYRYAPRNSKVKELLAAGAIGDVLSVHFEWMLDTKHGADYFRRWHRDKRNSGGLLVHKATHHFDLVNWWLGTVPETVFAMGGLRFYGRENAELRGQTKFYERAKDLTNPASDPFAIDLRSEPKLKALYLDAEPADGYVRDRNVFADGISIEDDMGVLVSYRNRAVMTYHLTAYSPWEGYRVSFNGTKGRLEYEVVEKAYVSGSEKDHNLARNLKISAEEGGEAAVPEPVTLLLRPHWEPPVRIHIPETNEGGHGGGDARMLRDIFEPGAEPDPLGRAAGVRDGLYSVLCGTAGNRSLATGLPVRLADLVPGLPE